MFEFVRASGLLSGSCRECLPPSSPLLTPRPPAARTMAAAQGGHAPPPQRSGAGAGSEIAFAAPAIADTVSEQARARCAVPAASMFASRDAAFNAGVAALGAAVSLRCLRRAENLQTAVAAVVALAVNALSGLSSRKSPPPRLAAAIVDSTATPSSTAPAGSAVARAAPTLGVLTRLSEACRRSARLSGIRTLATAAVSVWALSVQLHNASIVDVFWALSFVLQGSVYALHPQARAASPARRAVVWGCTLSWAVRLSSFLWWRNHQSVVGMGAGSSTHVEDFRYQGFRRYWDRRGLSYWWFSLVQVFGLQGVFSHMVSAPLLAVATAGPQPAGFSEPTDILGAAMWLLGYFFEHVGDLELTSFKNDPRNKGQLLARGVWAASRHPNYFGNAAMWWGLFLVACSASGGWKSVSGPLVMTYLLTKVSGVPMLERALRRRRGKKAFAKYTAAVSEEFVPWRLLWSLPSLLL